MTSTKLKHPPRTYKRSTIHQIATAALVTFTLGSGVALAQDQGELRSSEYDYDAVNSSIAKATSAVVEASSVLESAVVTVDGAVTSLANDVYKVNKSMVLKKSPWSADKLGVDLAVKAQMKRHEDPAKGALDLEGSVRVETDTLAMVKFMNAKKLKRCGERVESGLKRISQKHSCELAEDVAVAGSLGDIARAMIVHRDGEKADLEAFVKRAKVSVAAESNELMKTEGSKLLEKAKRKLHSLASVQVEALEDGLRLSLEHINTKHPGFKLKRVDISLTPEVAEVSGSGSLRMPTMLYDAAKPEVAYMLKGLEEGREYALEHIGAHARLRERVIAAMIKVGSAESAGQSGQGSVEQAPGVFQIIDGSNVLESASGVLQQSGIQGLGSQMAL